jgi:formylglycine-generating enzyme required for sulfatase activity
MKSTIIVALVLLCASPQLKAVTISTVTVGNPGNVADSTGFGAVAYEYRLGTYEVTNSQYAEFLNAKAASDPLLLFDPDVLPRNGILRSGTDGSYSYTVKTNMGDKPVNAVTWYDAIRFVNWLSNGQGNGDTETGSYTLLGGTPEPSNGLNIIRNPGATWVLPTEDEWYKAAYYQPLDQGGDADNYWLYPTRSNAVPTLATADAAGNVGNPGANVANYSYGADWNSLNGNVTTVGSVGPLSSGFYGTFDQGGNVREWNETFIDSLRGLRGSSWDGQSSGMRASVRSRSSAALHGDSIGFRVAFVPEPSTYALATIGVMGLLAFRRRTR